MLKKLLFTLVIVLSAPGLVNCAASGSAGVGEEGVSGSASGSAGEGTRSTSTTDTDD